MKKHTLIISLLAVSIILRWAYLLSFEGFGLHLTDEAIGGSLALLLLPPVLYIAVTVNEIYKKINSEENEEENAEKFDIEKWKEQ